jgi:hypothetical protein
MARKSNYGISKFKKNSENPFVEQAIEKINKNIVKKYKNASGSSSKAVLSAVDDNGEVVGHTTFIQQIEVDEEQFTKFYLSQFGAFWDLGKQAIRVFGYIMNQLQPKKDMFIFLMEECKNHTGYKSESSVFIGLNQLLENDIIARGPADSLYFINPLIAFNGDRVTYAKTYVKKRKKNEPDPNQLGMFNPNEVNENEEDN